MVLDFRNGGPGLVAVVDGVGWGTGMEAASWVRDLLSAQWQRKIPADAGAVSADVGSAASSIPEELLDGEFGHDFSFAAVLLHSSCFQVISAGRFGALHLSGGEPIPLFSPGTWVSEQVTAGLLTPAEALHHPLRAVCTGQHVTQAKADLFVSELVSLGDEDSVLIVELSLFQILLRSPLATWESLSAADMQKLSSAEKGPPSPVIRIFENAAA